jgi:hypothetical protein
MRIIRSTLGVAVLVSVCLAGGQAMALGSGGNSCQGSRAKQINNRDVRAFKCVINSSKRLRTLALSNAQTGFAQCQQEEVMPTEDQVWDGVDQDGSDLVSFANEGLIAAQEGDGDVAKGLQVYKPAYKHDPVKAELLQTAIRSLSTAKSYGVEFTKHISAAAKDLEAHNCHGVIDELDNGGATGAQGRDHDADTQESNAVDALEELAK